MTITVSSSRPRFARTIRDVMASTRPDSPVYELLPLNPPEPRDVPEPGVRRGASAVAPSPTLEDPAAGSAKALLDKAREASTAGDWAVAKALLALVHQLRPRDEFVIRQLVLATYKVTERSPDAGRGLSDARDIMVEKLNPGTTNDPETVGLWGAIHKQRWDLNHRPADLEESITTGGLLPQAPRLLQRHQPGVSV